MTDTLREHKVKAQELFSRGNLEGALQEYRSVMETAPDDATSCQRVAELLQLLGRRQESLITYEVLAAVWAKRGWHLRAIALCKVILQIDPSHGKARQLLASLHEPQPEAAPARPRASQPANAPLPPAASASQAGRVPRIPIFSQLSGEEFLTLLGEMELKVFAPGQTVIEQGQSSSSMFAIVEGSVELVRSVEGKERSVAFMGEGDLFGELALVTEGPSRASVRAYERTVVLELTSDKVAQLIRRNPSVGQMLQTFHRERTLSNMLSSHLLFRSLTREQKEAVTRDFQLCSVPAGKALVTQGQPVDALYLLLSGHCRVVFEAPDGGGESVLPALFEGDVFGEIALLLEVPATATVITDSRCTLLRLDRAASERHLLQQPRLHELLSRMAAERLERTARLDSATQVRAADPCI